MYVDAVIDLWEESTYEQRYNLLAHDFLYPIGEAMRQAKLGWYSLTRDEQDWIWLGMQ